MIILTDCAPTVRGSIEYWIYRKGELVEHVSDHNLVVNLGRTRLAELITGTSNNCVIYIGFGTSTDTPKLTDIQLASQLLIPVTSATVEGTNAVFDWFLDENTGNGMDIREFGLFTADSKMFTHQQRGRVIGKDADMTIKGRYIIYF